MRILFLILMMSFLGHSAFGAEDFSDDCTLSPFLEAVSKGDIKKVELFLQSGKDIDKQDCDGTTPLIIAAAAGQHAMCRYLILCGANIGLKTIDGWNVGKIFEYYRRKK